MTQSENPSVMPVRLSGGDDHVHSDAILDRSGLGRLLPGIRQICCKYATFAQKGAHDRYWGDFVSR